MEMIVKVVGAGNTETIYAGVSKIVKHPSFASKVFASEVRHHKEVDDIVERGSFTPVCLELEFTHGTPLLVESDFPVYAMNENGKTVQSYRPVEVKK